MCSRCHKKVAVVFVTKIENEQKVSEGLCIKCAKELGVPIDNMLGDVMNKFGLTPEQMENFEGDINQLLESQNLTSPDDDTEDGGAPPIDFPKLFKDSGFPLPAEEEKNRRGTDKKGKEEPQKKYKFLDTYCRNLTRQAAEGNLDKIIGREKELERVIQILCRRQKNNPCLIGEPGIFVSV